MKTVKYVQEQLMSALTEFTIAAKAGEFSDVDYYMGSIHAYLTVLGEYERIDSPWESLWDQVKNKY